MKKILFIFILLMQINTVSASSPAITANVLDIPETLNEGDIITYTTWIVYGNAINYMQESNCFKIIFDQKTLEYQSIDSIYNYKYDEKTNCIYTNEKHGFLFPIYVDSKENIRPLWTLKFKLNSNLNDIDFVINNDSYNKKNTIIIKNSDNVNQLEKYKLYDYNITNEKLEIFEKEYKLLLERLLNESNNNSYINIESDINIENVNNNLSIKDNNYNESIFIPNLIISLVSLFLLFITIIIYIIKIK